MRGPFCSGSGALDGNGDARRDCVGPTGCNGPASSDFREPFGSFDEGPGLEAGRPDIRRDLAGVNADAFFVIHAPAGLDGSARQVVAGALHGPACGDDGLQRCTIEIADVEEMPG